MRAGVSVCMQITKLCPLPFENLRDQVPQGPGTFKPLPYLQSTEKFDLSISLRRRDFNS